MKSVDPQETLSSEEGSMRQEVDFLLQMLHEYTESLRNRADAKDSIMSVGYALSTGLATTLTILSFIAGTFATGRSLREIGTESVAIPAIIAATFGTAMIWSYLGRLRRVRDEVERLGKILSTLTQRASQFRDHGKVSFAQRVAIEIRLVDAESLLKRVGRMGWKPMSSPREADSRL